MLLDKQFVDATDDLKESDYNKWLKNAKKTFLLSIPTQSLLMGDIHHYPKHSKEELNDCVIGNLSPLQIINILDSLDIHTIMNLITDKIHYYEITDKNLVKTYGEIKLEGITSDKILITYPFHSFNRSISLGSSYKNRDGVRSINDINAYEVLYSFLRLPISKVLSSINEVNTHFPCNLSFDDKLCSRIDEIQNRIK